MFLNTTLCYLLRDGKYLMLHRTRKEKDINKDKWIGVGGKMEAGESPEDCVRREVLEETGYALLSQRFRGIVTFVYGEITEYMYLYTSEDFSGTERDCDEGELVWLPKDAVYELPVWEGDKIFFRLLEEEAPFFSLKLVYDEAGKLLQAILDGKEQAAAAFAGRSND
ncbi:MAG: 8-oxo-dGTP diphosphatase [Lachnospiraceae bacterium]|nr:8-oxo-dGTP diphosphatase [Lachnospiraceae bacterium]